MIYLIIGISYYISIGIVSYIIRYLFSYKEKTIQIISTFWIIILPLWILYLIVLAPCAVSHSIYGRRQVKKRSEKNER